VSELLEDLGSLHGIGDGLLLASSDDLWEGEELVVVGLGSSRELFLGGVLDQSLLLFSLLGWEQNKFRLVFIQFSYVGSKTISALVVSSMINSDANSLSELSGKTGLLDFIKRETSSELNFSTIPSSLTMNEWSQLSNRPREESSCLISSGLLSE